MRRAAIQALHTARRNNLGKVLNPSVFRFPFSRQIFSPRFISYGTRKHDPVHMLSASMRFPKSTVAALMVALGGSVWYYQDKRLSGTRGSVGNNVTTTGAPSFSTSTQLGPSSQPGYQSTTLYTPPDDAITDLASSKRTLVVEDDQFYVAELSVETPLTKEAEVPDRQVLEMLTPEQATHKIRRREDSYLVGRGNGVVRYDIVQLPSNNPIEDDHAEKIVEVPQYVASPLDGSTTSDWMFWGVFDGHSGWTTSAKLRQVLISFVGRELNAAYKSALADPALKFPTPESIDMAIKRGFLKLDYEIIHESVAKVMKNNSKRAAAEVLAPALSGSCALLSFYDSRSKMFRVACTGDSRAVLGRKGPNGKWVATALSEDQTGGTPSEMTRLKAEHPGEDSVVRNGRILGGLEPSRAFGDSLYKWTKEVQDEIKAKWFGRSPPVLLQTPPYVTAEPVITTTKMEPEKGDFVVMATDGLWEMLSNEEVVGLVGQWLEANPQNSTGASNSSNASSLLPNVFQSPLKSLPVEKPSVADQPGDGQRIPIRQTQWDIKPSDARFVVEDKNAATHLVRNALGGRDRDMVCALLTLPSPFSRRYRDDLTVEVIFFGNGDHTGAVVQNPEASAPSLGIKAKL